MRCGSCPAWWTRESSASPTSGSAPLPADHHERFEAASGQRVLERYGMTETVMNLSNPSDGERRPGTVGFPLPGVEVRLDDATGEILVRGPNVFCGYYGRPEATAEAFTDDGWFRTGDIGRRDADGYFAIVGRCKELIISGGYNVYPREVEEALEHHPGVAEAAVVGLPSAEWGERVAAFIVPVRPEDPPSVDELTALAERRLAAYKKPRAYHFLDALPRNALGKVERARLVARA
jgi:malonyl-CoA/methylmalonyl-CoA synthetase